METLNLQIMETGDVNESNCNCVTDSSHTSNVNPINEDQWLISGAVVEEPQVYLDDAAFDQLLNSLPNADDDGMEVMEELYRDDTEQPGSVTNPTDAVLVSQLASPSEANSFLGLMFDEDLLGPPTPTQSSELPKDSSREAEIESMACYVKDVIDWFASTRLEGTSSKLKVHEVILVILLSAVYGDKSGNLSRILAFCDKDGREVSGESEHFKTLDTETMGLLWQKMKGNRTGSYDTFCRAMRVRREKSSGSSESYFGYLEDGPRCRKRVYRFGAKVMEDMHRMKQTLRLLAMPSTNQH